ncbi:NepR family anti-sigma factor [Allorhizobium terrae]|uniref:Anti-sigma factor NepR domain-containing protein n=1 Tax=Allorhizobium terrae TaxID=1848972 RepID=A0A4S3ZV83_9HYPH|nr:NepR family anti-sigma factor [Allorhizobium terrae]THF49718.1 hypothetical protein E6C51_12315 [Allorhizobium terrae]TWD50786.1 hypothetical protein FB480_106177 [Agrobacterium vitis]
MNNTVDNSNQGSPPSQAGQNDGISKQLRKFYQELEQEAVPDNLLMLLDKLDQAEKASAAARKKSDD